LLQHVVADATPRRATVGIDLRKTGPGPGHFGEKIITRRTRNALPLSGFLVLHGRLTRPRPRMSKRDQFLLPQSIRTNGRSTPETRARIELGQRRLKADALQYQVSLGDRQGALGPI